MTPLDRVNDALEKGSKMAKIEMDELVQHVLQKSKKGWKQFSKEKDRLLAGTKDYGEDLYVQARRIVRRNPTKAVSAALGTGLLLGAALFARRKPKKKFF